MKKWLRIISGLLSVSMMLECAPLSGLALAEEKRPVVLEDIKATQSYLLNLGHAGSGEVVDYNGDGCVDVFDLALAKRELLQTGVPSLTEFSADIRDVYIGKQTDVTFTLHVTEVASLSEDAVKLCDETGKQVAVMHDDGKDGDEAKHDGIYTAVVPLLEDEIRLVNYYAAAEGVQSDPLEINFYRNLTDEENAGFDALMEKLSPMSYEEVCAYLKTSKEVTDYSMNDDEQTVLFGTVYHIAGMWLPPEWDDDEEEETDYLATSAESSVTDPTEPPEVTLSFQKQVAANAASRMVTFEPEEGWDTLPVVTVCGETIDAKIIAQKAVTLAGKNKVAVLCPYYKRNKDKNNAEVIGNRVAEKLGSGSADVYKDNEVTLNLINNLGNYGVVILSTGFPDPNKEVNFTDDIVDKAYLILGKEPIDKLKDNVDPDLISRDVIKTNKGVPVIGTCRYAICKDYIKHHFTSKQFYNSFWYLNSPKSMRKTKEGARSEGFGDVLTAAGACAVVGYSNSVSDINECNSIMNDVFDELLNGKTLKQAQTSLGISDKFVYQEKNARTFKLANSSVHYVNSSPLLNTSDFVWQIGTVEAQAGDAVVVPIRVYNDIGTYGATFALTLDSPLYKVNVYSVGTYVSDATTNGKDQYRMRWKKNNLQDIYRIMEIVVVVPADAKTGSVYPIEFSECNVYGDSGVTVKPIMLNGYVKVVDFTTRIA